MNRTFAVIDNSDAARCRSCDAVRELSSHGYQVIPVCPQMSNIEGLECVQAVTDIGEEVDIFCIFADPDYFESIKDEIIKLHPDVVLVNPGSESNEAERELVLEGITVNRGDTLEFLEFGMI